LMPVCAPLFRFFSYGYSRHRYLHSFPTRRSSDLHLLTLWVCKLLMLICILTKNVITSCSVTMMLFLHLEVKPLMTLHEVITFLVSMQIGRAVQQECRDRGRMPSSA